MYALSIFGVEWCIFLPLHVYVHIIKIPHTSIFMFLKILFSCYVYYYHISYSATIMWMSGPSQVFLVWYLYSSFIPQPINTHTCHLSALSNIFTILVDNLRWFYIRAFWLSYFASYSVSILSNIIPTIIFTWYGSVKSGVFSLILIVPSIIYGSDSLLYLLMTYFIFLSFTYVGTHVITAGSFFIGAFCSYIIPLLSF